MADKKIQFSVVANGIPTLKNNLKGVAESARAMQLNIAQYEERTAQRIIQIERDKASSIKKINDTIVNDEAQKQRKIVEIEERAARRIRTIGESKALRNKQLTEKFALRNSKPSESEGGLDAFAKIASMAGFGKTSQLINWGSSLGIGSKMSAAGGGGEAAGAAEMAGLGAAALPVAAALGAIVVASKLVEIGFDTIAKETTYVASAFLGAASEISGFKNLQQQIVDASKNERAAAQIAAVAEHADISTSQVQAKVRDARKGTEFTEEQMGEAFAKYQAKTGQMLSPEVAKHIAKIATVNKTGLGQTADVYGQIKMAYPNLSDNAVMDIVQKTNKIGINGSVEFTDVNQLAGTVAKAGSISGDANVTIPKMIGYSQLFRGATGSVSEASTIGERVVNEIQKNAGGKFNVKHDKQGKIANYDQILEDAVVQKRLHPEQASKFKGSEAIQGITAISNRLQGSTEAEIRASFQKVVGDATNVDMSLAELDKRFKILSDTVDYQLKQSFTDLADTFGPGLNGIMKNDVLPGLKLLGTALMENKDNITETIRLMIDSLIQSVPAIMLAGKTLIGLSVATAYLSKAFVEVVRFFANTVPGLGFLAQKPLDDLGKTADTVINSQTKLYSSFDKLSDSLEKLSDSMNKKTEVKPVPGGVPEHVPQRDFSTLQNPPNKYERQNSQNMERMANHLSRKAVQ